MKNNIVNHKELKQRLAYLSTEKSDKQELIKYHAKDLYESFDPVNIIKNNITRILKDEEIQTGILSVLLSKGAGFITKKIFDKFNDTKKQSSSLFGKMSDFFSRKKEEGILSSFGKVILGLVNRKY
jgi:hypothetical protein